MQLTTTTAAAHAAAPAWPASPWKTWTPTHDHFVAERPIDIMQAAPIAPNAEAVAQADFAYGGNYMAHGSLDVFTGAVIAHHATLEGAQAAAQALDGAKGIVGIFRGREGFDVRTLLVSDSNRRGPGDDIRDPRPAARPRPDQLIALNPIGEPNGSWGHGDFRSLSALRFVSDHLLGFVGEDFAIAR
jgi:hypothetical protein